MRLKLAGDGTTSGTIVYDVDSGAELETIHHFSWSLADSARSSWVKLKVSDVLFDIDPSKSWSPPSTPAAMPQGKPMRLKVIGDGSDSGTYIVNADTEEAIQGISDKDWAYDDGTTCMCLTLEISDMIVSIDPNNSLTPGHGAPNSSGQQSSSSSGTYSSSSSSSGSTTSGGYSPGSPMSPGYSPTNPHYQQPNQTSDPPPDLLCSSSSCDHDWEVYVGFNCMKQVCKKCNQERPIP